MKIASFTFFVYISLFTFSFITIKWMTWNMIKIHTFLHSFSSFNHCSFNVYLYVFKWDEILDKFFLFQPLVVYDYLYVFKWDVIHDKFFLFQPLVVYDYLYVFKWDVIHDNSWFHRMKMIKIYPTITLYIYIFFFH